MTTERRRIVLLGSTGSIGRQTLDIIRRFPERFELIGIAAGGNSPELKAQVEEFRPALVAIGRPPFPGGMSLGKDLLQGSDGLCQLASLRDADIVVVATVGRAGLAPTMAAVSSGKTVALANKEALVMAGGLVTDRAQRTGAQILPIDSEHSAIWQCLRGEGEKGVWQSSVRALHLTASGGALRDLPLGELDRVAPFRVLHHPTWQMGPKVTVDSATLMNKGLEVIEAHWLFGIPLDRIRVLLHRESLVHSLVEFVDGSIKAQLGPADMRIPIQYALTYPERWEGMAEPLNLASAGTLTFGSIEMERYPCLELALQAAKNGRSYPAVLSAANEVAVTLFLSGRISFGDIPRLVRDVLESHSPLDLADLDTVLQVDSWAQEKCLALAKN